MDRRRHFQLTESHKQEFWKRWKDGEAVTDIAAALTIPRGRAYGLAAKHGGIAPPVRQRRPDALSLEEREEISRGLATGLSMRSIAAGLARASSTVTREVARNGGVEAYRAGAAEERALAAAQRPKPCRLATQHALRYKVAQTLASKWSPEQIAGWLKMTYPTNPAMHISHETIYRSLFVQTRGVLKKELLAHLRLVRAMRHPKAASNRPQAGPIIDAVSIRERPAEVEDRAVPGHWEGDLIAGSGNSYIATLVERQSRFTMLIKVAGKDTVSVASTLTKKIRKLPAELRRSLTWDRGGEMADHKDITLAADIAIYFCDPQSPWQRGTNENTNGLLRQYFPKGTDLSGYSQVELNRVARELNTRPRKTLGFMTPAAKLKAVLQ